jgi:lipoprotein-anchoring transpeptidase ErfK/SrfK
MMNRKDVFMKKSISIFLALIMVLSTMSLSVFALEELTPADDQLAVGQTDELGDGETPADGDVTANAEGNLENSGTTDPQVTEGGETAPTDATPTEGEGQGEGETVTPWERDGITASAEKKEDTNNAAVVTWTKDLEGAQAYIVDAIKKGEEEPAKTVKVTADAEDSATVSDLEAGKYTFKLHAYKDAECTETEEILPPLDATGSVTVKEPAPEPEKPATPKNLKTYSAYRSIALEWDPIDNAKGYKIFRDGERIKTVLPDSRAYDNDKKMAYIDNNAGKGLDDGPKVKKYKYYIIAVDVNNQLSEPTKTVTDSCVRQMYIKATFKQNVTLTSHDGKNKKHTFKAGETIYANGFSMGKYHFEKKIGDDTYKFQAMYGRLKNLKAMYTKSFNYSKKEAEYFANTVKSYGKSQTKYMVWVNLHTQHIYILKGKMGKWRINKTLKYNGKVYNNWEISSGTASTPTPWGLGLKYKGKLVNIYKRHPAPPGHGARLWNYFHSETAIHGPVTKDFGTPHSHGCIRNPMENAQFNYNKLPLHTRTLIF